MFHHHEDKVMKAADRRLDAPSCQHMFAVSARVKRPGSGVRNLFQLLIILLAAQASCQEIITTTSLPSLTITAQSSVYYFVSVNVDVTGKAKNESEIKAWLIQVFQNNLLSCVSPTQNGTTASPSATQNTSVSTNETTATTQSYNTTATTTALQANSTSNTIAGATSTPQTSNTTAGATSTSQTSNTTAGATSTSQTSNTTAAATSQTSNTTTAATSQTGNTTTATPSIASTTATTSTAAATSTASTTATTNPLITVTVNDSTASTKSPGGGGNTKTPKNPKARKRSVREIIDGVTPSSGIIPAVLFQGVDLTCAEQTAIKETNCSLLLKLTRGVSPCCILRTLCAASKASSDIHVVGNKADRTGPLQNECNTIPGEESPCVYNGQAGASCEVSGPAYQVPLLNSTGCNVSTDKQKNCSCSSYCSGTDAFYTLYISLKDPKINISSLISKIGIPPNCSSNTDDPCPFSTIASEYQDANVTCENTATDLESCLVILRFSREVPICDVSAAVMNVLQSEKQIAFNGSVTRTAICGNSVSDNPLQPPITLVQMDLRPSLFCPAMEESNILTCPKGQNAIVLLQDRCDLSFTTPGPNVTTSQPNTTASPVNVTSSPQNTTAEALNATATTTIAANVTVTSTLNTTNTSNPLTPSESATTTESADSQANALLELTRDVSKLSSSQVDQLVSQLENLLSGPTVSLALGNTSIHIVSNLLGASPEKLADSSNRIIGIVDTVALKLVLEDQPETLLSPAVALSVKPADGTNFQETFFSISDPSNVQVRGDPRLRRSVRGDSSIPQGSIRLPPSLTEDLPSEEQQLASRVQFNFYQKSTVFQDKSLGERRLNSGILGASVANLSITGLQDDVVIHLRNTEPVPANFVAKCVFWDFTFNNGSGGWNSNGCSVRNSTDNETICGCNHLTSFAILLDLSRQPLTSRLQATILTFITYIGCGISAIFLSVTLLTYLSFGKLRKDIPSKILIQLCLALLLLNLVFLVDAWLALYPEAVGLCISTAWFLHYFLLVAFTWMGLEAVHMYLALVKVFNSYISRYMVKFSLVGWGVPMLVVIIVIAVDKDNYGLVSYGKFSDGTSDDFCWLKNDIAFYVAVVAYFCIIFLFNLVMFIVVLVQLYRIKKQNPQNALHRTTLQDVRSVAGITILLGLTWGFAFFAWGPLNLPFMYLFAIFNSLQGFFIFIFHCAVKENVRRQWRTYLCCGKMRLAENSEWSRTATQKTVKKSSVTRLTSLQSSKSSRSNNSSSSSSFLVSDSSEQVNGIGSPFEDRQITADEDPSVDVILNEINSQYRIRQAT